jgi:hypothetical protein
LERINQGKSRMTKQKSFRTKADAAKSGNFILGAGISGLIWKFYHPEFEIISPVNDVKAPDPYVRSNLTWLHDCYETRKLLRDLGWDKPEELVRKAKVGYFTADNGNARDGWISDKLTSTIAQQLVTKKMMPWNAGDEALAANVPSSSTLSLSSADLGVNYMSSLTVDLAEVMQRLKQRIGPITHGYAVSLDKLLLGISNYPPGASAAGVIYNDYDNIICTLPAPQFYKIYRDEFEVSQRPVLNSLPITNIIVEKRPHLFDGDYEMIYYDSSVAHTRVSFMNNKYAIEITGVMSQDEAIELYGGCNITDYFVLGGGRIFSQDIYPPSPKIVFSGRFAQWRHSITTEHVINQALQWKHN